MAELKKQFNVLWMADVLSVLILFYNVGCFQRYRWRRKNINLFFKTNDMRSVIRTSFFTDVGFKFQAWTEPICQSLVYLMLFLVYRNKQTKSLSLFTLLRHTYAVLVLEAGADMSIRSLKLTNNCWRIFSRISKSEEKQQKPIRWLHE